MTAAVVVPCVPRPGRRARAERVRDGRVDARHLGVDVDRMKLAFCLLSAAMVGAIVAVSGLIGSSA
jgi:ABC-type Fe3+-siderophore transport system permease subunit